MKSLLFIFVPAIICQFVVGTTAYRQSQSPNVSLTLQPSIIADDAQPYKPLEINQESSGGDCGSSVKNPLGPTVTPVSESKNSKEVLLKPSKTENIEPITTPSTRIVSHNERIALCLLSCPIPTEYKPVCGSNNVTYQNPEHLICDIYCGVSVQLSKNSSCESEKITTGRTITKEEEIVICMTSCPVTGKYNPVCGSNNVTYENLGYLECAQKCGFEVHVSHQNACDSATTTEKSLQDRPTASSIEQSYFLTTTSIVSTAYEYKENQENTLNEGIVENHVNNENDGKNKLNSGNQADCYGNNYNYNNAINLAKLDKYNFCTQLCTLSSEYNPVCGNDGITYLNPGRLLCAQYCGVDVRVIKFAPCLSEDTTTTPRTSGSACTTVFTNPPVTNKPLTTLDPIQSCMDACPASLRYKPVCGSNNVTYRNKEVLQCARRCEINVSLKSESECSLEPRTETSVASSDETKKAAKIDACIRWCYETRYPQVYEPLCGSDNITYNSSGHIICAKQCGIDVYVKKRAACNDTTDKGIVTTLDLLAILGLSTDKDQTTVNSTNAITTTTTATPSFTPTPARPNETNNTVSIDMLGSIWSNLTTTTEEEFDLDQRDQNS